MSFKKTRDRMAQRRAAAEKRQAEYNKLTLEQKLAKLPPEPHAAKQRAKLLNQKENFTPKPEKKEKLTPSEFAKAARESGQDAFGLVNVLDKKPKRSKKEGK